MAGIKRQAWNKGKKLHYSVWNKGLKGWNNGHLVSKETRIKISIANKRRKYTEEQKERLRRLCLGRKHTEATKRKMSLAHKGIKKSLQHRMNISKGHLGMKFSEEWLENLSKSHLKYGDKPVERQNRNDSAYAVWVRKVKKRDNNICQLKDKNCSGYNIVHHIKNWSEYLELRYKISNGITLCQAHHPLKRAEEKRLIPLFEKLVSVSSV